MKKLSLLLILAATGCSYSKRDDHSFYYHNTTNIKQEPQRPFHQTIQQINNQPAAQPAQPVQQSKPMTDEDYVSQYKQLDPAPARNRQSDYNSFEETPIVYTAPKLPKYKVVYNGRVEYHTPVVYTPSAAHSYGDEKNYMYRNYRNAVYVSRPGY